MLQSGGAFLPKLADRLILDKKAAPRRHLHLALITRNGIIFLGVGMYTNRLLNKHHTDLILKAMIVFHPNRHLVWNVATNWQFPAPFIAAWIIMTAWAEAKLFMVICNGAIALICIESDTLHVTPCPILCLWWLCRLLFHQAPPPSQQCCIGGASPDLLTDTSSPQHRASSLSTLRAINVPGLHQLSPAYEDILLCPHPCPPKLLFTSRWQGQIVYTPELKWNMQINIWMKVNRNLCIRKVTFQKCHDK